MKKTLMILAVYISTVAVTAHAKTIEGKHAETIIKSLEIIAASEEDAQNGIAKTVTSGMAKDDVPAYATTISGKIGNKSVTCLAQEYIAEFTDAETRAALKNNYRCEIK